MLGYRTHLSRHCARIELSEMFLLIHLSLKKTLGAYRGNIKGHSACRNPQRALKTADLKVSLPKIANFGKKSAVKRVWLSYAPLPALYAHNIVVNLYFESFKSPKIFGGIPRQRTGPLSIPKSTNSTENKLKQLFSRCFTLKWPTSAKNQLRSMFVYRAHLSSHCARMVL